MIVIRALLYAALVRAGRRKATPPPGDPWENIGRLGTRPGWGEGYSGPSIRHGLGKCVALVFTINVIEALSWRILGPEIRIYEQEKQRFATGAPTAAEVKEQFLRGLGV